MRLCVLTVPSRFGLAKGHAFEWFDKGCLPEGYKLDACHILDASQPLGKLPNDITHVVILGETAYNNAGKVFNAGRPFAAARGSTFLYRGVLATCTFHPQDAEDFKQTGEDNEEDDGGNEKDVSHTQQKNYRFWIRADVAKLLRPPIIHPPFKHQPYPSIAAVNRLLLSTRNDVIFLDIESRPSDDTLNCIGISTLTSDVYTVPIYTYKHTLAYNQSTIASFFRALSLALCRNTVCVHNSTFDLFVLSYYYRILFGRNIYDTMLVHHRCHAAVEKSLGHVISYWTNLPFHKDQGILYTYTQKQDEQLWRYNGLDVYAMREVYKAQVKFLDSHPDYKASATEANSVIYPYLMLMLKGLNVDELLLAQKVSDDMRRIRQLKRIAEILTGIPGWNPNSSKQRVDYFHNKLKYPVIGRSKQSNAPSLGLPNLFKLRLKSNNPLINVIIEYMLTAKELGMLEFTPYTDKPKCLLHSNP